MQFDTFLIRQAYIFDIVNHYAAAETTIKKYHTFSGQQIGEYFGYSLLTEDFDNDGFPDIAFGAPFNSKEGTHDNGAVYVYRNLGSSSNFILHATLRTEYELSGRFGTTMTKIGDINQDGFNGNSRDFVLYSTFQYIIHCAFLFPQHRYCCGCTIRRQRCRLHLSRFGQWIDCKGITAPGRSAQRSYRAIHSANVRSWSITGRRCRWQ